MAEWKDIEGIKIALQKTVDETDNEVHKKKTNKHYQTLITNPKGRLLTMAELKPCPFCGNEYLSVSYYDGQIFSAGTFSVVCDRCGTCGPLKREKHQAIDAWNRREK